MQILTPKKQFPETRYFRFAWRCKDSFFLILKITLALTVREYFKFWPATCNLQITRSVLTAMLEGKSMPSNMAANANHTTLFKSKAL